MKKSYFGSDFAKNSITLVIGTVIAAAIPILIQPLLRRIFTPENFGAFAVYLNIIGIITIVSSLRYDTAIVLPKNDYVAANILSLTFILNIIFYVLSFISLLFFKAKFCRIINIPDHYSNYLYLLPISALLFSFYQNINFWLIRKKAFKASSINKISRRGAEGSVQLMFGYLNRSSGLFIGDLAGGITNLLSGINQALKSNFRWNMISKRKMWYVLLKYREFPIYNLLPTLLSAAAYLLPFIFINKFYSSESVGYLDLSRMVLSIPLALVSTTLSQVIFQMVAEKLNHQSSLRKELFPVLIFVMGVAILEIIFIQFFGPFAFGLLFGKPYELSGFYSQILVYSFVLNFINSTFSSIYISLSKIKLLSIWQSLYFLSIMCLIFFRSFPLTYFLKMYVGIEAGMLLISLCLIAVIVYKYETNFLKTERL